MKAILKKMDKAFEASDTAINQFVETEKKLKEQNDIIATTLDEAEAEIQRLHVVKARGLKRHSDNLGVIDRISVIVRGDAGATESN